MRGFKFHSLSKSKKAILSLFILWCKDEHFINLTKISIPKLQSIQFSFFNGFQIFKYSILRLIIKKQEIAVCNNNLNRSAENLEELIKGKMKLIIMRNLGANSEEQFWAHSKSFFNCCRFATGRRKYPEKHSLEKLKLVSSNFYFNKKCCLKSEIPCTLR